MFQDTVRILFKLGIPRGEFTNIVVLFSFVDWLPRYAMISTSSCSLLFCHKLCIQFNYQRPKAATTLQNNISDYFTVIFANFSLRELGNWVQLSLKFGKFTSVWIWNSSQFLTWYKLFHKSKKSPYRCF